jgi:cardiolipin synthase
MPDVHDLVRPETPLIISPLLTYLGFGLALVLLAHLLRQQRSPSSTIAWLLVILLLPYLGVPLYLMFGGRKMRRMAGRKELVYEPNPGNPARTMTGGGAEKILSSFGVPPATSGNRLALVPTGEEAYRELTRAIDEAQQSIDITTYILGTDAVGRSIVERLARRAAEGIDVRLLLDALGSWRVRRRFVAPLTAAGARVAFFMPVIHLPFRGRTNLRNHRKIVVVDNRRAIIGGMNLSGDYMGPTPDPKRWRDLSLVIDGPAVADLSALFRSDWKFATGEDLGPVVRPTPATEVGGADDCPAQVVASGPDVAGDPLYETLLAVLFSAERRIWVVTPYFVPDEMLARALELAARRGVDVRLVVPHHSNHKSADLARVGFLRQIHNAGGRILLYEPVMLHAKAVIVDDLAVIGSANMDMRSLFLNYEVALFLYCRTQVEGTVAWARALMADATVGLPSQGWTAELAENVVRLLAPLL